MGLFANVARLGVAKKVFDVARKPENQARIKGAISNLAAKRRKSR
jgi:hypothetical protein